ncbi:hypothetical protein EDD11_009241 [Mortierella claussenii]|nr:hypothetical protein EDD11_009241 [Mortierella claussenii]
MSVLDPVCVASDGGRLFALAVAQLSPPLYVLIKSNNNPSPYLTDLSWSLVSKTPLDKVNVLIGAASANDYVCAVDDMGVFSILSRRGTSSSTSSEGAERPIGLQYLPAMATASSTEEWRDLQLSSGYKWDLSYGSQLFYFKDSAVGTNTLMHATAEGPNGVRMAVLDPKTKLLEQSANAWNLTLSTFAEPEAVGVTNNNLFLFGSKGMAPGKGTMTSLQLQNATSTLPPLGSLTSANAEYVLTLCGSMSRIRVMPSGPNLVVVCKISDSSYLNILVYNGQNFNIYSTNTTIPLQPHSMVIVGSTASPPNPFIFLHDESNVYSVLLAERKGQTITGGFRVNITDHLEQSLGNSGNNGGSSAIVAAVVTVFVFVVVVALVLMRHFYLRKLRRREKVGEKNQRDPLEGSIQGQGPSGILDSNAIEHKANEPYQWTSTYLQQPQGGELLMELKADGPFTPWTSTDHFPTSTAAVADDQDQNAAGSDVDAVTGSVLPRADMPTRSKTTLLRKGVLDGRHVNADYSTTRPDFTWISHANGAREQALESIPLDISTRSWERCVF